mmetsp:Transcript_69126/g.200150  ORF Transcript_69126/g.200150 Transcript_69126/m.200150 type:complete len:234 (-) Transcript_69126:706-1407(-)
MLSMYGRRIGFSVSRRRASASTSRDFAHNSASFARCPGSEASSSKGSSSSTVAPRCWARTPYQKSKPHLAKSVCRSRQKCSATSASSSKSGFPGGIAGVPATKSCASAMVRRANKPPSSATRRPRIAVRTASSPSGGIHCSKPACVKGSSLRPAATTACTTSVSAARACGVLSLVKPWISLMTSAQARPSSRSTVASSLKACAARWTSGCSCKVPCLMRSAVKGAPPTPPKRF